MKISLERLGETRPVGEARSQAFQESIRVHNRKVDHKNRLVQGNDNPYLKVKDQAKLPRNVPGSERPASGCDEVVRGLLVGVMK